MKDSIARRGDFSPKKIILDRHSSLRLRKYRSRLAFRLRLRGRRRNGFVLQNPSIRLAELGISVHDQVSLSIEKADFCIGQIPGNLLHPPFMWIQRAAREMNAAGLQLHNKQQVIRDQSASGPDLNGRKVDRRQHVLMRFEERGLPL